jgi:MFS family permease
MREGAGDLGLKRRPWRRSPMDWRTIVAHEYKGAGTPEDPYVVVWLPHDTENPYRWTPLYKWTLTILAAAGTLAVTMGSSVLSAAMGSIRHDFPNHNDQMYIMVTGIYILGFVLGPFLWAPYSEVYGRRATYILTFIPLTAFDAAVCGAPNLSALLVLRFFAGMFGCSSMTSAGGLISDMFESSDRGLAMGVFGVMPWLGPVVGPICGGFLSYAQGWRWVGAVAAIFAGVLTIAHIFFIPETYTPVLLRERALKLSAATGRVYKCEDDVIKPLNHRDLVINQFKMPYILLFTEPIVFVFSIYMAVIFGLLYMQFTSFPLVFQGARGWSPGIAALAFIGIAVGSNAALGYMIFAGNPKYARELEYKGALPPEARLPTGLIGAILLPIGLFIFAWTCVPTSIHWIVPIGATVPYGAGLVLIFLACNNYLVDMFCHNAASVLAGGTVVRSIMGVVLPLCTLDMYDALGINWASTLVAFLSLIFVPVPLILMKYGRRIRRMTQRGRDSDDHMEEIVRSTAAKRAGGDPELGPIEEKDELDDQFDNGVPPARAASPTCPGIAPVRCNTRDERSAQMIVP